MLALNLALKEIKNNKKIFFIFILNVAIGLYAVSSIELFKSIFSQDIESKSKRLLGADIALTSKRNLNQKELIFINKKLGKNEIARVNTLFSMGLNDKVSRLIHVKAISDNFPFYGEIELNKTGIYRPGKDHFLKKNQLWAYEDLIRLLNVKNNFLFIGNHKFEIADIIKKDAQQTPQMSSVAPRVYISLEGLKRTNLIQKGSTINYGYFYKLAKDPKRSSLEKIKNEIDKFIDDPKVKVITPKDSSDRVSRIIKYLSDFLGILSLVGMFLANLSLYYLYKNYIKNNINQVAIYSCLGISKKNIYYKYFLHLIFVALIGSFLSLILNFISIPFIISIINKSYHLSLSVNFNLDFILKVILIGILPTIFLALPLIYPIINVNPQLIFSSYEFRSKVHFSKFIALVSPWALFFYFMLVYTSKSYLTASFFSISLLTLSFIIYYIGGYFLDRLKFNFFFGQNFELRHAIKFLIRNKISTLTLLICFGTSILFTTLIPSLKNSLQEELKIASKLNRPTHFLFDIQEEQIDNLEKFFKLKNIKLLQLSPMIGSRITKVNGKKYNREVKNISTREDEAKQRFRNRGVNLSYRQKLSHSEEIISGKPFTKGLDDSSELSVEHRYARRMNLKLGDEVEFDIMGVPLIAKIINLRKVKWTSFLPNFFMILSPGMINNAPQTFLAGVNLVDLDKNAITSQLYKEFSNISIVDLEKVIERISLIIDQTSTTLEFLSYTTIVISFLVFVSIVYQQTKERVNDLKLMMIVGQNLNTLLKSLLYETFILLLFSLIIGLLFSNILTYLLCTKVFDIEWSVIFENQLLLSAIYLSIGLLLTKLLLKYLIKANSLLVLDD